jgi:gluconate 5-dehydrogenase
MNLEQFSLRDKVALVTGGGTGIGVGISTALWGAGATVVMVGRDEQNLKDAVSTMDERADYIAHDITELDKNSALVAEVVRRHGRLDVLVNNAGVHLKKWAVDTSDAEFQNLMNVHINSAFSLTRHAIPELKKTGGNILFTASMASFMGMTQVIAYSVAKSGYLGFVRALSAELAEDGVRVNAIAPGWIQSAMLDQALNSDPERKARILVRTPMKRFGDPEDIGNAAVYLASPAAKFVTGVVLPVDGGAVSGF